MVQQITAQLNIYMAKPHAYKFKKLWTQKRRYKRLFIKCY
jgi:hypothetical protein